MDNFFAPFYSTTTPTTAVTTTTVTSSSSINMIQPSMDYPQNTHIPIYDPALSFNPTQQYNYPNPQMVPFEGQQIPYAYPLDQTNQSFSYPIYPMPVMGQNNVVMGVPKWQQEQQGISQEEERRLMDQWMTKVARNNRRLARQRSLSLRNASGSSSSSRLDTRQIDHVEENNRNLYGFCTPDNKRLRVLLKKELRNSDCGSLGRIVLPKREAEENLPTLLHKEGIPVILKDVNSPKEWSLRFKYWSNNKSRMYVLENTVEFIKWYGLEMGDYVTLYEDDSKNMYVSIKKTEKLPVPDPEPETETEPLQPNQIYNYKDLDTPFTAKDEEDASLALLIELLNPKEQEEANDFMTMSTIDAAAAIPDKAKYNSAVDHNSSNRVKDEEMLIELARATMEPSASTSSQGKMNAEGDHQANFDDDFFAGLDMLPEVNQYNHLSFDYSMDNK